MKNVQALFVIDESGSMASLWDVAINGFNSNLKALKENAEKFNIPTKVSIVKFNNFHNILEWNKDVSEITELSRTNYIPGGGTALYDALHYTVTKIQKECTDPDTSFALFIITDGEENCSREVNKDIIKDLMKSISEDDRWTVTYAGTEGINFDEIINTFHMSLNNTQMFSASMDGMLRSSNSRSAGIGNLYASYSTGVKSVDNFYNNDLTADSVKTPELNNTHRYIVTQTDENLLKVNSNDCSAVPSMYDNSGGVDKI